MNRRGFLGSIAAFAAQCTLDPELALWKPGAKLISVPKPMVVNPGTLKAIENYNRTLFNPELSYEAFHERYIVPYLESMEKSWVEAEINGTAWWGYQYNS